MAKEMRGPVEQMLSVVLPGFEPPPARAFPFAGPFPGFSTTWTKSEGCARRRSPSTATISTVSRPTSLGSGSGLGELSPPMISAYIVERASAGEQRSM